MRQYIVPGTPRAAPPEARFAYPRARLERRGSRSYIPASSRSHSPGSGAIAQSGERLLCTQEVAGSIPAGSIRASALRGRPRRTGALANFSGQPSVERSGAVSGSKPGAVEPSFSFIGLPHADDPVCAVAGRPDEYHHRLIQVPWYRRRCGRQFAVRVSRPYSIRLPSPARRVGANGKTALAWAAGSFFDTGRRSTPQGPPGSDRDAVRRPEPCPRREYNPAGGSSLACCLVDRHSGCTSRRAP